MAAARRELTLGDVDAIFASAADSADARAVYRLVERVSAETVGWRMLTVLRYVEAEGVVERVYSSNEAAYPVGGRKPLDRLKTNHGAMAGGDTFLAATRDDVREAFFDHELIFSLGITAILNAPIRHAGRRLGTLNLCGEEGMYGADEVARAKTLAGLLVPSLLTSFG